MNRIEYFIQVNGLQSGHHATSVSAHIVRVHLLCDLHIRHCIEAIDKLATLNDDKQYKRYKRL
jgi:hypothetical protein